MKKLKKQEQGFTLVELAIVLVIIGLLLGAVLKGREMIENAKYKNFANQISGYTAAMYTFMDKYNRAFPGDMKNADSEIPGVTTGHNGNGDGEINGGECNNNGGEESCLVWEHLSKAGIIGGSYSGAAREVPHNTFGNNIEFYYDTIWSESGHWFRYDMIPLSVAKRYDKEFDDGQPKTGSVKAMDFGGTGLCVNGDNYKTGDSGSCQVYIRF